MWQQLRGELRPKGLEIVTVALDTRGVEAVRPWIDRARPAHPSVIDAGHTLDAHFGIVNVPSGVWIDEQGVLVRPPETAYPRRPAFLDREAPPDASPRQRESVAAVRRLRIDADLYVSSLRDWVARGPSSRFVLSPGEVVRRSRPRPAGEAAAAAHFELGQHLHRAGHGEAAIPHFREASRLQPENWTYRRQAWNLLPPERTSMEVYGSDWLIEVQRIGPENYYPPLDM